MRGVVLFLRSRRAGLLLLALLAAGVVGRMWGSHGYRVGQVQPTILPWSMFLPLCCVYYPVAVLPEFLQYAAWALPPTYVFEGMRALLIDHVFRADLMLEAFAFNVVLFAAASFAFLKLLDSARVQGSLLQTGE